MRIYIQSSTGMGRTYDFDVDPSTTLKQLKTRFLERSNSKQDGQKMGFVFNEEMFEEDDWILSDCGIREESLLQAFDTSKRGRNPFAGLGTRFVDVSNGTNLKKSEWATTAPAWRIATPGLCLEGLCMNQQWGAYKQRVIMAMGFRKFDITLEDDEDTTQCPICQKYVKPTTCGFNRCWWRYQGKKDAANGPPKKCSSDWQQVGNAYYYFDADTSGDVVWRQLILEAVKDKPCQ